MKLERVRSSFSLLLPFFAIFFLWWVEVPSWSSQNRGNPGRRAYPSLSAACCVSLHQPNFATGLTCKSSWGFHSFPLVLAWFVLFGINMEWRACPFNADASEKGKTVPKKSVKVVMPINDCSRVLFSCPIKGALCPNKYQRKKLCLRAPSLYFIYNESSNELHSVYASLRDSSLPLSVCCLTYSTPWRCPTHPKCFPAPSHVNVHILLVSRAYASVKEKWALEEKQTSQMLFMTRQEEELVTRTVSMTMWARQGQL